MNPSLGSASGRLKHEQASFSQLLWHILHNQITTTTIIIIRHKAGHQEMSKVSHPWPVHRISAHSLRSSTEVTPSVKASLKNSLSVFHLFSWGHALLPALSIAGCLHRSPLSGVLSELHHGCPSPHLRVWQVPSPWPMSMQSTPREVQVLWGAGISKGGELRSPEKLRP